MEEKVNQWLERGARAVDRFEIAQFNRIIADAPPLEPGDPAACNAHSVRCFQWVRKMMPCRNRVLEIGFNLGYSARIWLDTGVDRIVSLDVRNTPKMLLSANSISAKTKRFDFMVRDDQNGPYLRETFDLIFIDGAHDHDSVMVDIALGDRLGINVFFFDDWLPQFGPGVQSAAMESGLLPIAVLGNMGLCVRSRE